MLAKTRQAVQSWTNIEQESNNERKNRADFHTDMPGQPQATSQKGKEPHTSIQPGVAGATGICGTRNLPGEAPESGSKGGL